MCKQVKKYISDLHFGHPNVTKQGKDFDGRGFYTLDDMYETIIRKWNVSTAPSDEVYILGDIVLTNDKGEKRKAYDVIRQLNGNLHLIRGNHDRDNSSEFRRLFAEISDSYKEVKDNINGKRLKVVLSHYFIPFYNQHSRDAVMLYGHSHKTIESDEERRIIKELNNNGFKCKAYNVGCMYDYIDYAPRSLKYIVNNYR